ncbi:helix-turn-helix DNA binding domain protein [Gordonia phage CheeseTouch]
MGTSAIIGAMPNQPKTPKRGIRMSDDDWERLRWVAERRGQTISDVLRSGAEREYRIEIGRQQRATQQPEGEL